MRRNAEPCRGRRHGDRDHRAAEASHWSVRPPTQPIRNQITVPRRDELERNIKQNGEVEWGETKKPKSGGEAGDVLMLAVQGRLTLEQEDVKQQAFHEGPAQRDSGIVAAASLPWTVKKLKAALADISWKNVSVISA